MILRTGLCGLICLVLAAPAWAQTHPLRGPDPAGNAAEPDQPMQPQNPVLVPRAPHPQPPFTLTPQEEVQVDRILNQWEQHNRNVETFDCRFKRWTYDVVFGPAGQAKFVDLGVLRYGAPDRGMFQVEATERDGREVPIEEARTEHWISDGKSIFEFNPSKKQLIEHKLPPELQGKAIANSPLPFLFGAEAKKLKERYFTRLIPTGTQDQVCLEAFPRFQQDAANFHHAQFKINTRDMSPLALKLIQPNEKDCVVYAFYDSVVNDSWKIFKGDPFRASTPSGWQKVVEGAPAAQANRSASDSQR